MLQTVLCSNHYLPFFHRCFYCQRFSCLYLHLAFEHQPTRVCDFQNRFTNADVYNVALHFKLVDQTFDHLLTNTFQQREGRLLCQAEALHPLGFFSSEHIGDRLCAEALAGSDDAG